MSEFDERDEQSGPSSWGIPGSYIQKFGMERGSFNVVAELSFTPEGEPICCEYYVEIDGVKLPESIGYTRDTEWRTAVTKASSKYISKLVTDGISFVALADDLQRKAKKKK